MSDALQLTVAIPVHDDLPYLTRLLGRLHGLGCVAHVVVVDDGSPVPLDAPALCAASGLARRQLTLVRHDRPQGPGVARNRALAQVRTGHLLFLDADDLPTAELPGLLADLAGQRFDFCIFQHHDSRSAAEGRWGQTRHDRALWRAAGTDIGALGPVTPEAAAQLMRTANYPWNKIYRTDFLRRHRIACSPIPVHEDIELHWRSFLCADRILASDRVAVIHFVDDGGNRLTNRAGPERLQVFQPLDALAAEIAARGTDPMPFLLFSLELLDWIRGNLRPELQPDLTRRARDWMARHLSPAQSAALDAARPGLRARLAPAPPGPAP
ncbi:glycosyltransferase family 2 protein [Sedimentitalea sp. HM32M-2]|uniref:glycosyltransferase family 2 protein n=1 Tax=Sedimentitalea sp. HM32M-2 TaxID=3351566 RepID=UPI00364049BD